MEIQNNGEFNFKMTVAEAEVVYKKLKANMYRSNSEENIKDDNIASDILRALDSVFHFSRMTL